MSTPRTLNKILIRAILMAILAWNNSTKLSRTRVNGFRSRVNMITVIILKKMEKWANFLLSLLEENKVNNESKLVPIFAPNMRGMAWWRLINPDMAKIWMIAIKTLEDCNEAVSKIPTSRLSK